MPRRARSLATAGMLAAIALAMTAPACRQDMYNQAKATPLTESVFFVCGGELDDCSSAAHYFLFLVARSAMMVR